MILITKTEQMLQIWIFSSSECIAWLTVLNIEAVAIVTMNALTIIIYLKERILRKCSMYLVISLAVADMFVTYNLIVESLVLGSDCNCWKINLFRSFEIIRVFSSLTYFFPLASVTNLAAISHSSITSSKRRYLEQLLGVFGLQLPCLQLSLFHHFAWAAQISLICLKWEHHTSPCNFVAF